MIKVSPSGIGYLMECPRCLWLLVNEKIQRPRGIFPSLPSGMDNVFKKYFDKFRLKGALPPEIDGKINAKLFNDMTRLEKWREIDFGRGGLSSEFPEFDMILRGAIDELLIDSEGKFVILDYKTRGYPLKHDTHEHYRDQLDLYGLLFERNKLLISDKAYLLFFWPNEYQKNSAKFNTELVELNVNPQRAYQLLEKVHNIINGPKPSVHEKCEYCMYRGSLESEV